MSGRRRSWSGGTLPRVARFLYSCGAAPGDVDDLVQETLFRGFRGLDGWRREASFRSWLFTISGNLLKDEFRRRKGRQMLSIGRSRPPRPERPRG